MLNFADHAYILFVSQKLQTAKADVEGKTKELEDLRKNVRNLTTELEEKKHMLVNLISEGRLKNII